MGRRGAGDAQAEAVGVHRNLGTRGGQAEVFNEAGTAWSGPAPGTAHKAAELTDSGVTGRIDVGERVARGSR